MSGYSGYSGISGYSGSGISGYSGYSGAGASGYSGVGDSGYSGYSGTSGYSGYSGTSGYSGYSGGPVPTEVYWATMDDFTNAGVFQNAFVSFFPFSVPFNVPVSSVGLMLSLSGTTSSAATNSISLMFGLYTQNAGSISLLGSTFNSYTWSSSTGGAANWGGFLGNRQFRFGSTFTLTQGQYWAAFGVKTGVANCSVSVLGATTFTFSGYAGVVSATTHNLIPLWGHSNASLAATNLAPPTSVAFNDATIVQSGNAFPKKPYILFTSLA